MEAVITVVTDTTISRNTTMATTTIGRPFVTTAACTAMAITITAIATITTGRTTIREPVFTMARAMADTATVMAAGESEFDSRSLVKND